MRCLIIKAQIAKSPSEWKKEKMLFQEYVENRKLEEQQQGLSQENLPTTMRNFQRLYGSRGVVNTPEEKQKATKIQRILLPTVRRLLSAGFGPQDMLMIQQEINNLLVGSRRVTFNRGLLGRSIGSSLSQGDNENQQSQ